MVSLFSIFCAWALVLAGLFLGGLSLLVALWLGVFG